MERKHQNDIAVAYASKTLNTFGSTLNQKQQAKNQ